MDRLERVQVLLILDHQVLHQLRESVARDGTVLGVSVYLGLPLVEQLLSLLHRYLDLLFQGGPLGHFVKIGTFSRVAGEPDVHGRHGAKRAFKFKR